MKVVVLGAGISGLATGWYLKRKFGNTIELSILEKSERAGGWIRTIKKGEFLFEAGPRGFRPAEATLELVKELRLESELIAASREAKKRYIALDGKLHPFGLGFLLKQGLVGALIHEWFTPRCESEDETIADFMERRFNHRLSERVMDPLTKGIFGGDMRTLSMRSCFPSVWKMEQEKGSVIRGMLGKRKKAGAALYSFREGMETLTEALARELREYIRFEAEGEEGDVVISTLPAQALARVIGCEDPFTYASLTLVHLGWQGAVLPKRGYGFLVPTEERGEILGMTWDSEIFPREEQTRICIMLSGQDPQGVEKALKSLQKYVGIKKKPDVVHVSMAEHAITQYTLHHEKRMEAFKQHLPQNMHVLGTSFVGPGVNDAILAARELVRGLSF